MNIFPQKHHTFDFINYPVFHLLDYQVKFPFSSGLILNIKAVFFLFFSKAAVHMNLLALKYKKQLNVIFLLNTVWFGSMGGPVYLIGNLVC